MAKFQLTGRHFQTPFISSVFNELAKKKEELTTLSSCKLLDDIGRSVSLWECLWAHGSVVDADLVDLAGEESSCIKAFAGTYVHATV